MIATMLELPVGKLVADCPSRSRVFERFGIDYCCGGKKALSDACAEQNVNPDVVLRELAEAGARPDEIISVNWSKARLTFICDYIVLRHHGYLTDALPRLVWLSQKASNAHSDRHPELKELASCISEFWVDMKDHMTKEEHVLFPHIKWLEGFGPKVTLPCGPIENPIRVMTEEHDAAGAALKRMRELTNDFTPPPTACNTWKALIDGLKELEADMHEHVHIENNILFPRATELEHTTHGQVQE